MAGFLWFWFNWVSPSPDGSSALFHGAVGIGVIYCYRVGVVTRKYRKRTLTTGLAERDIARYLERQIAAALQSSDRRSLGERSK